MFDRLHNESLYFPMAGEILDIQNRCLEKLYDYNHTRPSEGERRAALDEARQRAPRVPR